MCVKYPLFERIIGDSLTPTHPNHFISNHQDRPALQPPLPSSPSLLPLLLFLSKNGLSSGPRQDSVVEQANHLESEHQIVKLQVQEFFVLRKPKQQETKHISKEAKGGSSKGKGER